MGGYEFELGMGVLWIDVLASDRWHRLVGYAKKGVDAAFGVGINKRWVRGLEFDVLRFWMLRPVL